jgi:hypothetical protein
LEVYTRGLPSQRDLPVARTLFVRFSAFFFWRTQFLFLNPARAACTVLIRSSNQSLFGNCDSFKLETCLNYLTRLGAVSHRPSPPLPHSHLARANAPEEPVNFASAAKPFGQFKRSRANQPNPTFPRLPGIILETNNLNLSTATVRFVLSMNCEHHSKLSGSYNELI